ncbi:glycerol-3-phosphate acyltransferase [Salmonella enterica]|nr:glycerol-3-phosphate acyltransferase [Salmonella enterica]
MVVHREGEECGSVIGALDSEMQSQGLSTLRDGDLQIYSTQARAVQRLAAGARESIQR